MLMGDTVDIMNTIIQITTNQLCTIQTHIKHQITHQQHMLDHTRQDTIILHQLHITKMPITPITVMAQE